MKILIGAGGNAKDVLSFLFSNDIYFVDDFKTGEFMDYPIIGTIDEFIERYRKMDVKPEVYNCIGSEGDNLIRNRIYEKLKGAGVKTSPLLLSPQYISRNVTIGENVLIGLNAQIHHDCRIGESTVISPGAIILGGVTIKVNAFIGAGAIIRQHLTIGEGAVIGMGSIVLHDIEPNSVYVGNPARLLRKG